LNENGLAGNGSLTDEIAIRKFPIYARASLLSRKSQNTGLAPFPHTQKRAKVNPEAGGSRRERTNDSNGA
jgi:hypothetical protein